MSKIILAAVLLVLAFAVGVGVAYADDINFLQGVTPLNNCSVYYSAGTLTSVSNRTDNNTAFLGFFNNSFSYVSGTYVYSTNVTSDTFVLVLNTTVTNWMVVYNTVNQTLVLTVAPGMPDISTMFLPTSIIAFYQQAWGIGTALFVFLVPISTYVKTKNPGIFAVTLLFISAGSFSLEPSIINFAYIVVAATLAALTYRLLGR
jgi:hypothetical protein